MQQFHCVIDAGKLICSTNSCLNVITLIFWGELATWLKQFDGLVQSPENLMEYEFLFVTWANPDNCLVGGGGGGG